MTMHFFTRDTDPADSVRSIECANPLKARRKGLYRNGLKRFFDVALTLIAAPIVLPVVLILAALIALDGKSPLYSQSRIGKDGRHFRMWKLRTMVHDADTRLESYLEQNPWARHEWNVSQKLKNDPRITTIGRLLRKTSMDELPQLLNVLNGTMALVGPRPMMPQQQSLYPGSGYYDLKPGLTGFWQISDRNKCEFAERAYYDDLYNERVSLSTDVRVLMLTVGVVLRGTGC